MCARALTNNPAKAALPAGVEVAPGYLGRPSTLPAALDGIDTVYLAPLPQFVDEFVACATAAGVRRVVVLPGNLRSTRHSRIRRIGTTTRWNGRSRAAGSTGRTSALGSS